MNEMKPMAEYDQKMYKVDLMYKSNTDLYKGNLIKVYNLVKEVYAKEPPYSVLNKQNKPIGEIPYLDYQIRQAEILANYCLASEDLVIVSLLGNAVVNGLISDEQIEKVTGSKFGFRTRELLRSIRQQPQRSELDDLIRETLQMKALNELEDAILDAVDGRQTGCVKAAIKLAKKIHSGDRRASGEPYLMHPFRVALLVADVGAEAEIVAAAILHDVVEDTKKMTPDEVRLEINKISNNILRYVEAVTAVEKEIKDNDSLKENNDEVWIEQGYSSKLEMKKALDRKTAEKLMSMAKDNEDMKFAVLIKEADRLHNLQTIGGMQQEKITDKIQETRDLYLPLFRNVGTNAYIDKIIDRIWYINNEKAYIELKHICELLIDKNRCEYDIICGVVKKILNDSGLDEPVFKEMGYSIQQNYSTTVFLERVLIKDIRERMDDKKLKATGGSTSSMIKKNEIPLMKMNVVYKLNRGSTLETSAFLSLFIDALNNLVAKRKARIVICDIQEMEIPNHPGNNYTRMLLADYYQNYLELNCFDYKAYNLQQFGSVEGIRAIDNNADAWRESLEKEIITIRYRDDSEHEVVRGSTPLDVAYNIHPGILLYATGASINDHPATYQDLFRELEAGDKVEIMRSQKAKDLSVEHNPEATMRIEWIVYMGTVRARKFVSNWLTEKFEK